MPFQIVSNDITRMNSQAIVNAANTGLLQGGGVCGAIFQAAGAKMLQKECCSIGYCPVGQAVITKGYHLPAKYIIHTVGPVWNGGIQGEQELLAAAYRSSLELARKKKIQSIAFPLISTGTYGYPKAEAMNVAVSVIGEFLMEYDMDISLVVYETADRITLNEILYPEISQYMNTIYVDSIQYMDADYVDLDSTEYKELFPTDFNDLDASGNLKSELYETPSACMSAPDQLPPFSKSGIFRKQEQRHLEDVLKNREETFSEMLLRMIDEKGKTDVEIYKKANMDRKLFSKLRSNKDYQPKKSTALALAVSLELSLDETKDLLQKAGYSLTLSHKSDVIIQYFIENKNYNIHEINEALFCFEQPLLGV